MNFECKIGFQVRVRVLRWDPALHSVCFGVSAYSQRPHSCQLCSLWQERGRRWCSFGPGVRAAFRSVWCILNGTRAQNSPLCRGAKFRSAIPHPAGTQCSLHDADFVCLLLWLSASFHHTLRFRFVASRKEQKVVTRTRFSLRCPCTRNGSVNIYSRC